MRRRTHLSVVEILTCVAGVGLFCGLLVVHRNFIHDDAYITLRYAVNLAETGLPQWNPGEWTEGYTSVLHVYLLGGMIWLGADPVSAMHAINLFFAIVLLATTAIGAYLIAPDHKLGIARALTLLAVAASPPIALWVLGGLETVIVSALLLAGIVATIRFCTKGGALPVVIASFCFSLAILTRLDSAVFITGTGLGLLIAAPVSLQRRFESASIVVAIPALVAFIQMAVRFQIYGELFPLTFYAKADIPFGPRLLSGMQYLLLATLKLPVLVLAIFLLFLSIRRRTVSAVAKVLFSALCLHFAYVAWTGGDHMAWTRFLVPAIAPAALLLLALSSAMELRIKSAFVGLAAIVTSVMAILIPPAAADYAAQLGRFVGEYIDENWPRNVTIALNTAGSVPFFAREGRIFVDMLGLNDPIIAKRTNIPRVAPRQVMPGHAKGSGEYVLSRKPDYIILSGAHGSDSANAFFVSGAEMHRIPEFHACYEKHVIPISYPRELSDTQPEWVNPMPFTFYQRVCP